MNLVEIVEGKLSKGTELEGRFLNLSALEKDQTAELSLCKEVEESLNGFFFEKVGLEDINV